MIYMGDLVSGLAFSFLFNLVTKVLHVAACTFNSFTAHHGGSSDNTHNQFSNIFDFHTYDLFFVSMMTALRFTRQKTKSLSCLQKECQF